MWVIVRKAGITVLFGMLSAIWQAWALDIERKLPETGISGVYEAMVGTDDARQLVEYFTEFGFSVTKDASIDAQAAEKIYGVRSGLHSIRMQNGVVDSHGLLRILEWEQPLGPGVGYAPPETVGQRMAVMRTRDIFRLYDTFQDLREKAGQPWLPTEPVFDDLYGLDTGNISIKDRRVGVRENAVYGQVFNHVFFQRYGYTIPGYGTINEAAPLQTSEFTHHDFIVKGDLAEVTGYYMSVLGLRAENDPVIDGDWQKGPGRVFLMEPGESHWYRGFVSPNNACGKLKFFSAMDPEHVRDRSRRQRVGELGITLHSLYTPELEFVHELATEHGLQPSAILENEFSEQSFMFTGPDGVTWQILDQPIVRNEPTTKFELLRVNN
ncbi:MAG: VOC family protein [Gammaproteobacteria bacterium]|nr:VOC family protein [Gammaproteobacteria bacterium]